MATEIFGIGAAQVKDNAKETIIVDGMNLDKCSILSDEHADEEGTIPMFRIIGATTKTKVIHVEKECEDIYQEKCWRLVGAPFVYMEGKLADDSDHPDAKSAAALLRFVSANPEVPLKIGLSVEGGTIHRDPNDEKILLKTVASGFALTIKPCNSVCQVFLKNDLAKSDRNIAPPARYFEALKKSQSVSSIVERPELLLSYHLTSLKKSLSDYVSGFTDIKCYNCGHAQRMFKSTKNMPNGCPSCGNYFSMSDIWKALNR